MRDDQQLKAQYALRRIAQHGLQPLGYVPDMLEAAAEELLQSIERVTGNPGATLRQMYLYWNGMPGSRQQLAAALAICGMCHQDLPPVRLGDVEFGWFSPGGFCARLWNRGQSVKFLLGVPDSETWKLVDGVQHGD